MQYYEIIYLFSTTQLKINGYESDSLNIMDLTMWKKATKNSWIGGCERLTAGKLYNLLHLNLQK